MGYGAINLVTSGSYNTSVGGGDASGGGNPSSYRLTTGSYNVVVGNGALGNSTSASANTAVGYQALYSNVGASNNTALGYQAAYVNTTATSNVAVGYQAGYSNNSNNTVYNGYQAGYLSTTTNSTAVGFQAHYRNLTGNNSVAIGYQALYGGASADADGCVAVGHEALLNVTTGDFNVALGMGTLRVTSSGANNVAVGYQALNSNTTASQNTAVGHQSLYTNLTGTSNTAVGWQALYNNSTTSNSTAMGWRALLNSTAQSNTAFGYQAGSSTTSGTQNVAVGDNALYSNETGNYSVAVGSGALVLATGSGNTGVGNVAGGAITTGAKNTILGNYSGNQSGLDIRTASNNIVLSDGDGVPKIITNSGGVTYLGSATTNATLRGNMTTGGVAVLVGAGTQAFEVWDDNSTSIPRLRVNRDGNTFFGCTGATAASMYFTPDSNGGSFVSSSSTGTKYVFYFQYNNSTVGYIYNTSGGTTYNTTSDYRLKENIAPMTGALAKVAQLKPSTYKWKHDGSDGQGFIAHELQEFFPDAVVGVKDDVDENGKIKPQGIDTSFLVATLTAAIQEQQAIIESLKARLDAANL